MEYVVWLTGQHNNIGLYEGWYRMHTIGNSIDRWFLDEIIYWGA